MSTATIPTGAQRMPHVYVIIFALILLTALLGLIVPGGAYERDADGRVVAGTFTYDADAADGEAPERPRGWALFAAVWTAPLAGIDAAASIIAFILILGGTFRVIEETGAFEALIRRTLGALRRARSLVIPLSMLVFSIGGALFGMSEEIIPFVLLLLPLVRALGYRPIVAVAIPLVGSQIGFAGAMVNPFTVGIAQGIAGLPPLSGWPFRTAMWIVLTVVGIAYVQWMARDERADDDDAAAGDSAALRDAAERLGLRHVAVLWTLAGTLGVILWGVQAHHWYVLEIGGAFLALGVIAGIVGGLSANRIAEGFVHGARDLVSAALVVGLARGIVVLAQDVRILDTVLHGAASGLGRLPGWLALDLMFVFQTVLNFFLPSGSGQAALTMPIMAPLAELIGLTRQMAVLAFQLGDGFSNMIVPTSAVLMGSLEAGKVSYERWFAFIWRLQLALLAVGFGILGVAVMIGFGP
ncbi:MAG: TIGR00366 family protein [Acidobacteriota bacterium]